jgi:hypothetical protein
MRNFVLEYVLSIKRSNSRYDHMSVCLSILHEIHSPPSHTLLVKPMLESYRHVERYKIARSAHTVYLRALCGSEKNSHYFPIQH